MKFSFNYRVIVHLFRICEVTTSDLILRTALTDIPFLSKETVG